MTSVFVYGSLLFDSVVKALLGKTFPSSPAILQDHARYRVEQPGRVARGPVLLHEPGSHTAGKVLLNVDDASLAIFDLFESPAAGAPGYSRTRAIVELPDGTTASAVFYLGTDDIRPFTRGPWSEDHFEREHLSWYLEERIPELKKKWAARQ